MGVLVQEVSDADLARACEIEVAAYADNAASPALFPGPFPPDAGEKRVEGLATSRKEDATVRYMKAVDEETNQLIAFAAWHFYETEAAASTAKRSMEFGPGSNPDACLAFFGGLAQSRERVIGNKPHIYLRLLHSDPNFQGRGAGSALVKWGFQKADELRLPCFLESSPGAHKFYKNQGFKDVEIFSVDLSPWGGPAEPHIAPLMIREHQA